jgi:hypothetical protein
MQTSDFRKVTPKKRNYLDQLPDVVSGKLTKRQAARKAGFADSTSISRIETPSLKAAFSRLMRQHVPAHVLVKRVAEGLAAEETKFFQHEGVVTDSKQVIAWSERRQYAQIAAEWGGYVEKDKGSETNVAVGFSLYNNVTLPKRGNDDEQR